MMVNRSRVAGGLAALALVAAAVVAQPPAASAAPAYTVVEIGPPAGFGASTGAGINESGQVVGTVQQVPYGGASAFVWDRAAGVRVLGQFLDQGTIGRGINDRGEVTGGTTGQPYSPGYPFVWTAAAGFSQLSSLGSGTGINNARQVAGTTCCGPRAVRFAADGQPQLLGALGGEEGSALGINARGQVVGWARASSYLPRPFLWDPATGLRDLGTFQPDGGGTGTGHAVNDLGHVVGDTASGASGFARAFLWRDGRLTAIGPEISFAYAVNDSDHAVGQYLRGSGYRAFVFRDGRLTDLNTLIPRGTATLTTAVGVNDTGWIVANGTNSRGQQRAFVLVPA